MKTVDEIMALVGSLANAEHNQDDGKALYHMAQIEAALSEQAAHVAGIEAALRMAVTQNEHDMLMTGDELRECRKFLKD